MTRDPALCPLSPLSALCRSHEAPSTGTVRTKYESGKHEAAKAMLTSRTSGARPATTV